jgi:hypothetical protein
MSRSEGLSVRASPHFRGAMNQADIFRLVLPQNGLSFHRVKSRIRDGSPAGFVGILADPLLIRNHILRLEILANVINGGRWIEKVKHVTNVGARCKDGLVQDELLENGNS